MTFALPEALAISFTRRIPARERSRYVSEALAERLAERERQLVRSCEIANADDDVREIEREFDALPDSIPEPWSRRG
ncbi:MAG: hypothetical protein ACREM2_04425 [Vulcanimicrobiaceae bacterium]